MNPKFHGEAVGMPGWVTPNTDISLSRVGDQRGFQEKKDQSGASTVSRC